VPRHGTRREKGLERRLARSRIGRFKAMADYEWDWPKRIDRDAIESALRLSPGWRTRPVDATPASRALARAAVESARSAAVPGAWPSAASRLDRWAGPALVTSAPRPPMLSLAADHDGRHGYAAAADVPGSSGRW
jgi:hypothetical protein